MNNFAEYETLEIEALDAIKMIANNLKILTLIIQILVDNAPLDVQELIASKLHGEIDDRSQTFN